MIISARLQLAMGFGVVSLLDAVFRRAFTSAGLRPGSAVVDPDADADTTVHFWAHRSLLLPPPPSNSTTTAAEAEEKKRPVVVLVHGFGPGPTWQWAAQVGPLSRHFDLVVPTLLFFGASRTRAPARSEASQAAAVAALLAGHGGHQHLPGLGVGRPVHVVGASYGGIVAYHLARALQHQQRGVALGKVVLCDSDVTKGPEDDRALAARGGVEEVTELMVPADTKMMRRLTALSFHRPPMYLPECIARDLLRITLQKSLEGQRQEKIELIKGMTTATEGSQVTPLPQEMLIIWGEFDQIFPLEKAYKVKEKLGEKATVKVIPNSGHLPSQEEPKLFNRVLLEFLLQPSISNGSATTVAEKQNRFGVLDLS